MTAHSSILDNSTAFIDMEFTDLKNKSPNQLAKLNYAELK